MNKNKNVKKTYKKKQNNFFNKLTKYNKKIKTMKNKKIKTMKIKKKTIKKK